MLSCGMNVYLKPFTTAVAAALFIAGGYAQSDQEKQELLKQIELLKKQQAESQASFDKRLKALEEKLSGKGPGAAQPVKIEGLLQARFDADSGNADSFFIRRSEIKLSGSVTPTVAWTVMVDVAKQLKMTNATTVDQSSRILQDAFITAQLGGPYSVEIGQKKIPFSAEGMGSSAALDTLERALFLATGKLGDARDTGIHLRGKWKEAEAIVAVLNGTGENQNSKDTSDKKTFGARAVFTPSAVPGLAVGGSALSGNGPDGMLRERFGVEGQYRRGGAALRGEFASALTGGARQEGWFGQISSQIAPKWEGVIRLDSWDPNLAVSGDREIDTILGLNHYVSGQNAKLQFNYVFKNFQTGKDRRVWQLGVQTRW